MYILETAVSHSLKGLHITRHLPTAQHREGIYLLTGQFLWWQGVLSKPD